MECQAELTENLKCKPAVIAEQGRSPKPTTRSSPLPGSEAWRRGQEAESQGPGGPPTPGQKAGDE